MHQDRHFLKFQKDLDLIKYMNTQIRRSKVRRVVPILLIFNIDVIFGDALSVSVSMEILR